MSKSLDNLESLTTNMNVYIVVPEPILETVDNNLTQATNLIRKAQNTLVSSAKEVNILTAEIKDLSTQLEKLLAESLVHLKEVAQLKQEITELQK